MPRFACNTCRFLLALVAVVLFNLVGLDGQPLYAQSAAYGTWAAAGQLTASHKDSAATTLQDGRVLITGGVLAGSPVSGAEFYNGSTIAPAPSMAVPRASHTVATLSDGRVLVAGGFTAPNIPTNSIEIFNPATNAWSNVPRGLQQERAAHTMTVLRDGRVLIAGGLGKTGPLNTLEIFDPATNISTLLPVTLSSPRMDHAAALVSSGWVMFAGGFDGTNVLATVEGFNPTSGSMLSPLTMSSPRRYLSATSLLDGRILLAGGNDGKQDLASLEIFDVSTAKITSAGSLAIARSHHSAIRLPDNGNVLIAGGESSSSPVASAEMFAPVTGSVQSAGTMSSPRSGSSAAWLMARGKAGALVVGGDAASLNSTADVYTFPQLASDKPDYAPNTIVTVTGRGWAPGETITLVFHENPLHDADETFTSTADSAGTFVNTGFKPDLHDENMNFIVTASGTQSGATAQITFTDATYSTQMSYLAPSSGAAGAPVAVNVHLEYLEPYYDYNAYYYSCNCYNCNCGWGGCNTCCSTCQGRNYYLAGYYPRQLTGQTVQFTFNVGSPISTTTDGAGNAYTNITVPPGATQLTATYPGSGDGTYGASQQTINFTVTSTPTTLAPASVSATYGSPTTTLSATLTAAGSAVAGETVSFTSGGTTACSAVTNSIGVAQCSAPLTGSTGQYSISASFAGDAQYQPSSGTSTLTIAQGPQAPLAVNVISPATYNTTQTLTTTGGSGTGAVTYSVGSSTACSVNGATLTITAGTGTCSTNAIKAGDTNYYSSTATQTVVVTQASKSISFTQPVSPVNVNDTATLVATSSNGDPVAFTVTSGAASITGNSLVYTTAGTVTITASSDATLNFAAAAPISATVVVAHAPSAYVAPSTAVGTASPVQTATVNFTAAGTLASVNGLTQGATGLDFSVTAGTGTCVVGQAYGVGQACTVAYTFRPVSAGSRFGALTLRDASGKTLGISYVSGTGVGPLGLFTSTQQSLNITGLNVPRGLSTDGSGNLYVLETGNNKVDVVASGATFPTLIASLPSTGSGGTAIDGAGNLFVNSTNDRTIYEFAGGKAPAIAVVTGTCGGDDNIETDGAGNLYYTCYSTNTGAIMKVDAVTHATTQIVSGNQGHRFVAMTVDAAGNVFAPDFNTNTLYKVAAGSTTLVAVVTADGHMNNPHGIALDPAGNIYVTNYSGGNRNINRYATGSYAFTSLPAGGSRGVVIDGSGNLYSIPNDVSIAAFTRTVAPPISFTDTAVGTTSNSVQSVAYENDGNAALTISQYAAALPFSVAGPLNTCAIGDLAPGAACSIGATFTPTTVGSQTGSASLTSNTNNLAGTTQPVALIGTGTLGAKTITFPALPTPVPALTAATLAATASNGDLVTYTVLSGKATIAGTTLNYTTVGTVVLAADSASTSTYKAATRVTQTLTVTQIAQTITFAPLGSPVVYGATSLPLSASGGASGNAVTFTVASGPATLVGNTLTITGAGTVVITANQTGNVTYTAAQAVSQTLVADQAHLSVQILGTPTKTYDATASATLTAAMFNINGLVNGDSFTVAPTAGTYASPSAGKQEVTVAITPGSFVAVTGTLANYTFDATAHGAGLINQAVASVTPAAATKVYGTSDPALTGSLSGFLASDNVTAAYTRSAGETVLGSPYSIQTTLTPAVVLANYKITYNPAALTITPAPATVVVGASGKTYGTADPAFTGTTSGFLPADNVVAVYARTVGETVLGSPYSITATLSPAAALSNYSITNTPAVFTISKALASVTPAAATKTYGAADPTLTGTTVGFLPADNVAATYTRTAGETVAGTPYSLTATLGPNAVLSNYAITYNTAALSITPAPLRVAASSATMTYGGAVPVIAPAYAGLMNGDTAATLGAVSCSTTATSTTAVGTYPTSCSGAVNANYALSYTGGTVTINQASLSVSANNATRTYGSADGTFTGVITGIVNSDAITATYTSNDSASSGVGSYAIVPALSGAALSNYAVTLNNGALSITPALLSVTANDATRVYGSADSPFTGVITGILNSDAITSTYTSNDNASSPVGSYAVVPALSGATLGNYTVTVNKGTLTITPALLSVTANDATRVYGSADGTFTGVTTGIVNSDAITSTYTSNDNASSPVGSYAIVPALSGATLSNYTLTIHNGTLTVTPAVLVVMPASVSRVYGSSNPAFTGLVAGLLNNDPISASYSTTASPASDTGTYSITAKVSDSAGRLGNYIVTLNTGTLTITKANQVVLWVTPAAITYATPLSAAQLNASISVPGVSPAGAMTYTPSSGTVLNAGVSTLTVNVAGTSNYNPATASVQLTVNKAQTAFSGLSSQTITFRNGTATFVGTLSAPTAVPAGQQLTVTLNGVIQTATASASGSFTTTFNTATLPVSSTGYTVSYNYFGDPDFLASTTTSKLTVAYSVCYGYDPAQVKKSGSTFPIKIRVCDVNGTNVATANTVVVGVGWGVSSPTYTPLPNAGNSNGDGTFRNTGDSFMWNLKTTGIGAGSYNAYFSISGDPTLHFAPFAVR